MDVTTWQSGIDRQDEHRQRQHPNGCLAHKTVWKNQSSTLVLRRAILFYDRHDSDAINISRRADEDSRIV